MQQRQIFSIKKLKIGVVSLCIGCVWTGYHVQAEQIDVSSVPIDSTSSLEVASPNLSDSLVDTVPESISSVSESPQVTSKEMTATEDFAESNPAVIHPEEKPMVFTDVDAERSDAALTAPRLVMASDTVGTTNALEELEARAVDFPDATIIAQLTPEKTEDLKQVLVTNFETEADEVALSDVAKPKTSLSTSDLTRYFIPKVNQLRKETGIKPNSPENAELVQRAMKESLEQVNADLFEDDILTSLAPETRETFESFLNDGLLATKPNLTVAQLKKDLPALYRGAFYLQQQYSFEEDLPKTLVFQPHTITNRVSEMDTAYDRLKAYGGAVNDKRLLALSRNMDQFRERQVNRYTGANSVADLIEQVAVKRGQDVASYFNRQTQALLASATDKSIYETLKTNQPNLLLPILSQGKGIYLGTTSNSVSVGMLESYIDQVPELATYEKARGSMQPEDIFFKPYLSGQENYLHFLNSVKKKPVPFMVALDTMNIYNQQGRVGWSAKEGREAAMAVRRFFAPMNYWQHYINSQNLGGHSTGQNSMTTFETRLMNKDASGVGLFTHEMTHSNDEEALFGGHYQVAGRRAGQGAEVYARGLFEAIDNTQGTSLYPPVFNINTAIPIVESEGRVQARHPLNDRGLLENYMKNLMDLVAYLEQKEATLALAQLSDVDKSIYFNQVKQNDVLRAAGNRMSTNESFVPYGHLGAGHLGKVQTVSDLVDASAVSAQFVPRGVSPILTNLTTNQYDSVPLLESFYAVQQAAADKNTVGDISFKRHAYEILAWKGWDAFIAYVSNQHESDQAAFASILQDSPQESWADFKKAQYERLSQLKPINNLWSEEELEKKLSQAIQADLAILKQYRHRLDPILQDYTEAKKSQVDQVAVEHHLRERLTNVRKVKQNILHRALQYNDLMATVLKDKTDYDIIYVSNTGVGNGETPATPMNNLLAAIEKVREGGKIVLVGDVTERNKVTIDKALTIEGLQPENTLTLNEDLTTSKTLTLKDFTLNMYLENQLPGQIVTTGKELTIDNVSTAIPFQDKVRPSLVLDNQGHVLTIKNARNSVFREIEAKHTAQIKLEDRSISVLNGIRSTAPVGARIDLMSQSNRVRNFYSNAMSKMSLTFDGVYPMVQLYKVDSVNLINGARVTLQESSDAYLTGKLHVEQGSVLTLLDQSLLVDMLSGAGEIVLPASETVTANLSDSSAGGLQIQFTQEGRDYSEYEGKRFVQIDHRKGLPQVTLLPSISLQANDEGAWIYQVSRQLVHEFTSETTGKALPEAVSQLLPEVMQVASKQEVNLPTWTQAVADPDGIGEWHFVSWKIGDQPVDKVIVENESTVVQGVWRYEVSEKQAEETYREVVIPFETIYEADSNLAAGQRQVERSGQDGVRTYTTRNGQEDAGRVTKQAISQLIRVGTKPTVQEESLPFSTQTIEDVTLAPGTTTELQEGRLGVRTIKTYYDLDAATGEIRSREETTLTPALARIVKVGTGVHRVPVNWPVVIDSEAGELVSAIPSTYPTVAEKPLGHIETSVPKTYPIIDERPLGHIETSVPQEYPTVAEKPLGHIATSVPKGYPIVAEKPLGHIATSVPKVYPTVAEKPLGHIEISVPKVYPTVAEKPLGHIEISVPKTYPTVAEKPLGHIATLVPNTYPTVAEKPLGHIDKSIPNTYPTVAEKPLGHIETSVPKEYPTVAEKPLGHIATSVPNPYPTVSDKRLGQLETAIPSAESIIGNQSRVRQLATLSPIQSDEKLNSNEESLFLDQSSTKLPQTGSQISILTYLGLLSSAWWYVAIKQLFSKKRK